MTKLIVEMEMPQACPCEFADDSSGIFRPCFAYYGVVERAVEFNKCVRSGGRPEWCPIKGALPEEHGDLIDRSLLCADLAGVILSHRGLGVDEVIARQNAVITAERKDNGNNS